MKKIILLLLSILCLTGCFKRDTMEGINIYTTIYPITYVTEQLYGNYSNINSIYPNGVNVQLEDCENCSNYTLTEKQLSDYSNGSLFIFSGLSKFSITKLILIGLSINIFVSSLISLIILVNPLKSYMMMLILSGGVTNNEVISNKALIILFVILMFITALFIPKLNYLRLDSDLLSTDKKRRYLYTLIIIILASLLTSLSVFSAGILGFVGIIAPQISRMLLGQDYRWLFISNILIGSSLILVADYIARTVIYPLQIPLGLVIAFIGAPVFVFFLVKKGDIFSD